MALYNPLATILALLLSVGYIVALVFAVVRRRQLGPRAATLLITGLAVLLLLDLFQQLWPYVIDQLYRSLDRSGVEFGSAIQTIGLLTSLVHLVGVALIVLAVFAVRGYWPGTPAAGPPLMYPPPPAPVPAAAPLPPAGAWPPAGAPPVPPT